MQILVLVCLTFLILWKTIFTLQLSDQLCIGKNKGLKVCVEFLGESSFMAWHEIQKFSNSSLLDFSGNLWEWEKQKLYLQNSLPATSCPLRKYPNLSVAQVLCWWGYHQMLFSVGRAKQRFSQQNWIFEVLFFMKKKAEIWKRLGLDAKTWHSWFAELWLKANSSLNEHLSAPWCWCDVCGDAAPFSVLTEKAHSHGKAGAQP